MNRDVFICDGVRTPFGRYGGALAAVRTDDLAAIVIRAVTARNPSVDWEAVDEVFIGCANQAGEDNRNVARTAVLRSTSIPMAGPLPSVIRWGASGARLIATAMFQLRRTRGRHALCTMCIGVGQGISMVIERV